MKLLSNGSPYNNSNSNNNSHIIINSSGTGSGSGSSRMAVGKSIKMYLTIFVATTCVYMVLYQYHMSRQPLATNEVIKHQDKSTPTSSFALYFWAPMSMLNTNNSWPTTNSNNTTVTTTTTTTTTTSTSIATTTTTRKTIKTAKRTTIMGNNASSSSKSMVSLAATTSAPPPSSFVLPLSSSLSSLSTGKRNISAVRTTATTTTTTTMPAAAAAATKITTMVAAIKPTITKATTIKKSQKLTAAEAAATTTTKRKPIKTTANRDGEGEGEGKGGGGGGVGGGGTGSGQNAAARLTVKATGAATLRATLTAPHKFRQTFVPVSEPPPLYIITPTYRRPEQLAELTRLGYTLKHVANLLWLVIEDANKTSALVAQTLDRIGVPYEYLIAPMPEEYKTKRAKPRGVSNRNRGLAWLRANASEGVFYFADDDNTYDINIFEQMRYTKKVAMWPVGLVTKTGVSSPIIRKGKLDGYYDGWIGGRKYPVDMAGFAVSIKFLHERPHAKMPFKPGYEEDGFLRSLTPLLNAEIELLASECTEILTWHTQTKKNSPAQSVNLTRYGDTNLAYIDKLLVRP